MTDALEAALDELYAARPENFVATRAALGKKHGKEVAAALKKRRKPTQTAYALNQLARRYPDAVAELVDAGRALARAQRKALRGGAAAVREAIDRQRTVIRDRMADVAKLVGELGVDPTHLPAIASALQAALVDPTTGEALETGRLEKPPEAPTGFPLAGMLAPSPAKENTRGDGERPRRDGAQTRAAAKEAKRAAAAEAERRRVEENRARAEAQRAALAEATRLETIAARLATEAETAVRAAKEAAKAAARARKVAESHGKLPAATA